MGEDIEATTVGHTDQNRIDFGVDGTADDLIQNRDEHIKPLNRKPGFAGEVALQKVFKAFNLGQPL